jgi:hypothetical protein
MDASGGKQPAAVTLKEKPRSRRAKGLQPGYGVVQTPDYSDGGWWPPLPGLRLCVRWVSYSIQTAAIKSRRLRD